MPDNKRQFSDEAVAEIVRRALHETSTSEGVSEAELIEIAGRLNIPKESVAKAIASYDSTREMDEARATWLRRNREQFYLHLRVYLIVNAFLFVVDVALGAHGWFFWSLIGWGLGIGFHAMTAFFPQRDQVERGARSILRRKRIFETIPGTAERLAALAKEKVDSVLEAEFEK